MGAKNKKIHNRHERWCTDFALQLSCDVRSSVVLRQQLEVDALVRVIPTTELWVELTPDLLRRDVIVEHFSGSVSTAAYANSLAKIAHLLQNFEKVALKERGDLRPPILVPFHSDCDWLTASSSPRGQSRATQAMPEHRRGVRQRDRGEGPASTA